MIHSSQSSHLFIQHNPPSKQTEEEQKTTHKLYLELIATIRLLPTDVRDLMNLCDSYEKLVQNPLLEMSSKRELFKEITFLLKRFPQEHVEVNRKLVSYLLGFCEFGEDITTEVNVLIHVHAYKICIDSTQRQAIGCKLAEMLEAVEFMHPIRNYCVAAANRDEGEFKERLGKLANAAGRGLGESIAILRKNILEAMHGALERGEKTRDQYQFLNALFKNEDPGFFPGHLQKRLTELRSSVEVKFKAFFPDSIITKVNPTQVREFQKEISQGFTQFLEDLTALPCLLFEHNKLPAEIHVVGSLAREEIYPFSDFEGMILFDECAHPHRSQEQKNLLRSAVQYTSLLVAGIGETEALPIEIQPLTECRKGFALDALFAKPPAILEELNKNLQILLVTPGQLLALQKESSSHEETRLALYSLLKTKKIASTSQGRLDYKEPLQKLLDETFEEEPRRQQIAHQMIQEIHIPHYRKCFGFEGSQGWIEKPFESHETIDIKEHFIKTLFHAITTLSIYHGINKTNILDILDALTEKPQPLFTGQSASLLKEAVSAIYLLRLKMHLTYLKNPWKGKYDVAWISSKAQAGKTAPHNTAYHLEEEEAFLLEKSYWFALKPLYHHLQQMGVERASTEPVDLVSSAFSLILDAILHEKIKSFHGLFFIENFVRHLEENKTPGEDHLNYYRELSSSVKYEPLREAYLEQLSKSSGRSILVHHLAGIPNRDGFQQARRLEENQLFQDIQAMGQCSPLQESASGLQVEMIVPQGGTLKIKSDLVEELFDPITGALDPYSSKNPKEKEYQNCRHTVRSIPIHKLHIKQLPDHPCMEYAAYSLIHRLFEHGPPPTQLVKISIIKDSQILSYPALISRTIFGSVFDPEVDAVHLSPVYLTELLISHLLLLPGDASARNFIYHRSTLTCIDNDVCFVDPIVQKGLLKIREVQFTSILFCLKKDFFLDSQVIEHFCAADPLLVLNGWLNDLIQREKCYTALFPEVRERKELLEKNREKAFTPFFLLASGGVARLYEQMTLLQSYFREQKEIRVTPFDLLNHLIGRCDQAGLKTTEIGPYINKAYLKSFQASSAVERLRQAVGRDISQSMTSSQALQAQIGKVPSAEQLEKREFFSPEQGLKELFALNFERCTELGIVVHEKEGASFKSAFQKMVKEGQPDLERQRLVLASLLRHLPEATSKMMKSLNLSHCAVLDDSEIEQLIRRYPDLEVLDLRYCPLITSRAIQMIAEQLKNLQKLFISGCTKITALEIEQGLFRGTTPLIFEKLALLHASHCPLARVQLQAPQLIELKLKGTVPITKFFLLSPSLEIFQASFLEDFFSLTSLQRLQKLVLNRCMQMTQEMMYKIFTNNPLLKHLELHHALVAKFPRHSSLRTLSFSHLPIQKLEGNYHDLIALNVKHCNKLEEISLSSPQLENLVAETCVKLKKLDVNAGELKKLSLRESSQVAVSQNLLYQYKKLELLDLTANLWIEDISTLPAQLPLLEELYLDRCPLLRQTSLAFNHPFPTLRVLHIAGGVPDLAEGKLHIPWEGFRSLTIQGDHIAEINMNNNPGFSLKHSSLSVKNLQAIHLMGCHGDKGELLQALECFPRNVMKFLIIEVNDKTDLEGLTAQLHLLGNMQFSLVWGKKTLEKLSDFMQVFSTQVTVLKIRENRLGDAGAIALAEILPHMDVTVLDLEYNQIGDVGVQVLASALPFTPIKELNLALNTIKAPGLRALAEALPRSCLRQVNLGGNEIGNEGVEALAEVLPRSQIVELRLWDNQIGDLGAKALAKGLLGSQIHVLELWSNQIENGGAKALAEALPRTPIVQLNLEYNLIEIEGIKALVRVQTLHPHITIYR